MTILGTERSFIKTLITDTVIQVTDQSQNLPSMAIMRLQAFIVTLIFISVSYGSSVSEFDQYYADEMGVTREVDCYVKVALSNCGKGITLHVRNEETDTEEPPKTISGKDKNVCFAVKCMSNRAGKLSLSGKIVIGGEYEQSGELYLAKANPDVVDSQNTNGLYASEIRCKNGKASISTVTCVDEKKSLNIHDEEDSLQVEELENEAFFAQGNDWNNDNEDFPMKNDNDNENYAFMMSNGDSHSPPLLNLDNKNDHAHVQVLNDKSMEQDDNDNDDDTNTNKNPDDKLMLSYAQEKILVKEGITAKLQWNNWFRGSLYVYCPNRQAIYWARSAHSNHYEDRIWYFNCKTVADYNFNHCYWTGYQNSYDLPLFAHCGANYVIRGIYSRYSRRHRDRRFQLRCCHAPSHYTRNCQLSGYVNGWDGWMNYQVGGRRVFTGLYSYHDNGREDRIWKVASCYYSR